MIENTTTSSSRNRTFFNLYAIDLGRRGWARCVSQDFMTAAIRLGSSENHTTASQSVAMKIVRPFGLRTREASDKTLSTSATCSATCLQTTTSNDASG